MSQDIEARAREVLAAHTTSPGNPRVSEAVAAMVQLATEVTASRGEATCKDDLHVADAVLEQREADLVDCDRCAGRGVGADGQTCHHCLGTGAVIDDTPCASLSRPVDAHVADAVLAEKYAQGLLVEEMGETLKLIGKALRFGMDAPGPDTPEYCGRTARQMLPGELGDLHAAIRFAAMAGVFSMADANDAEAAKIAKLLDPASRDANGNRLAPDLSRTTNGERP
jgi:hypothetical protein